jgi:HK97 family phage major capsid protein
MNLRELLEQRAELVNDAREMIDQADRENRDLTKAENKRYDEIFEKVSTIEKKIKLEETQRDNEKRLPTYKPDDRMLHNFDQANDEPGRALNPSESVRSFIEQRGGYDKEIAKVRPGQILRALALGPKSEAERLALSAGVDVAGGYSVPAILASSFIDHLRAQSVMSRAGAKTLPIVGDTTFTLITGDPTPTWRPENVEITEDEPTFGALVFKPKTLAVLTKVSRELLEDSVNIEQALTNSVSKALALELDRVCLVGTGAASEPMGLQNWGINSVALDAAPTYDALLEARTEILTDNAEEPNTVILHPRDEGVYSKLKDGEGLPYPMPPALKNLQWLTTTQIPITLGTGTDSIIMLGNFRNAVIAMRTDIRIEVLKEAYADHLQYGFLVWLRADFAPEYEEAFCQVTGVVQAS